MYTVDVPFTWGMVQTAIKDPTAEFPLHTRETVKPEEHSSILVLNTVEEMRFVRDWLIEQSIRFRLFGHVVLHSQSEKMKKRFEKCVGFRFLFDNEADLKFFTMICHNGRQITVE